MAQNPNQDRKLKVVGTGNEERMTLTSSAAPDRYVMGQDAQLHDIRTGLVIGPWSDGVKRANALWHKARRGR
jgi:hypothetical protein